MLNATGFSPTSFLFTHVQIVEPAKLAADKGYRDEDGKPFTAKAFHMVLRGAFKGRGDRFTTHDVALAEFICDAHLRNVNLQKLSSKAGCGPSYLKVLEAIKPHAGKEFSDAAGDSTITIVEPE